MLIWQYRLIDPSEKNGVLVTQSESLVDRISKEKLVTHIR